MSWNSITGLGRIEQVQQPTAIGTIPKPEGAKYFFGPQDYADRKLGKIMDSSIPPIPPEFIECLSKPSPFPPNWNRPIGENHLLLYIPGRLEEIPDLPALYCLNDSPDMYRYTLRSWYETYAGSPPNWLLIPLNAQPNYDLTPNPQLTFQGPESHMEYCATGGYGGMIMYMALEVLKLQNTEIKYINVPNSAILRNEIWSLQKTSS